MDNTALLLPLILSALVTTTFSLSCMECAGMGDKPCQGAKITCPSEYDACVATLESIVTAGHEVTTFKQYCGKKSMCSYSGSMTTLSGQRKVSSACCFTSNCSPPTPKFPAEKTDKNGVSCKSCTAVQGSPCEPSVTVECTGDQKECVSMTSKLGETTNVITGCGTAGFCSVKDREYQLAGMTSEITITCSGGTDTLPPGLLPMLLAAIFIMKIIS